MVRLDKSAIADRYTSDEVEAIKQALETLELLKVVEFINQTNAALVVESFENTNEDQLVERIREVRTTKTVLESFMGINSILTERNE